MRYSVAVSYEEWKLKLLAEVKNEVEQNDNVSEALQEKLDQAFGKDDPSVTEWREILQLFQKQLDEELMREDPEVELPQDGAHRGSSDTELPHGEDSSAEDAGGEDLKGYLLALIRLHITVLQHSLESLKTKEERAHEANLLAHKLPSREFIDKLIRYETALEKKKEKTIKLLLQLKGK